MESSPLAFFQHEKFGSLRVVRSEQGVQWFVVKDVCGCHIREIEDSRFGSVKAYHVDVIEAFRLALRNDLNMLGKYRIRRAA